MIKKAKVSKEIRAILKPYNEDIKRHMSALSEEFKVQVKVIGEQYGDIQKTLESHTKTLESHTEMIGGLLIDMTEVKGNVKLIKESLNNKVERKEFEELRKHVFAE